MSVPRSTIGWCDFSGGDANFVIGCTPVSAGCANCYARAWAERHGRDFGRVEYYLDKLRRLSGDRFHSQGRPFRRGKDSRAIVFPCDLADLFHESLQAGTILHAWETMAFRQDVDFVILTKRIERAESVLFGEEGFWYYGGGDYTSNMRLGVTAEDQAAVLERVSRLRHMWMGPKVVSVEPMLCPVDLRIVWGDLQSEAWAREARQWWVICGGESGPRRRQFDVEWARALRDQCVEAQVPFFYKQGSALRPGTDDLLDGRRWREFPE